MEYTVAQKLSSDPQIWRLAADLGLRRSADPVQQIRNYCRRQLREFYRQFGCKTLPALLEAAAASLDTLFIEVRDDEELEQVKRNYVRKGELAFAILHSQLGPTTYAITFRRRNASPGERKFVSVIDCRGNKAPRAYFSKWHELAHLLTLTDQARMSFCRTHMNVEVRDPEESLMEVIAGDGAFLEDLVKPHAIGQISFERIALLRAKLCPEASDQASLIGFTKAWPEAAVLIRAELALKKSEQAMGSQTRLAFHRGPTPALRAVQVTTNDAAARAALAIHHNMRVPEDSIIHQVFRSGANTGEQEENLSWWTTSDGQMLADRLVRVTARRRFDHVQALITSKS